MGKKGKRRLFELKNDLQIINTGDMNHLIGGKAKGKIRWQGKCGGILPQ